jgi:Flp pilus assembly protein TadD
MALVKQGKSDEAVRAYREGLRLNPDSALALNELAWFLATDPHAELRNGEEAVRLAERACELTGHQETRCLGTLDAAYAEAGRFDDALRTAGQTQEMALVKGETGLAAFAAERIELYRAGKCYRQY